MRTVLIIVIIILMLLISFISYNEGKMRGVIKLRDTIETIIYKRDTIELSGEASIKYINKLQKIYIRDTISMIDTVIHIYPFDSKIDTILNNDTIKINYSYPANIFDLSVRYRLDSIVTQEILNNPIPEPKETNYKYFIGAGLGATLILLILGAAK